MRALTITLLALAALCQTSLAGKENVIDRLIREALEYVRTTMKDQQPFHLPEMPELDIQQPPVQLKVTLKDVLAWNGTDFTVDQVSNNLQDLSAQFGVTVPYQKVMGDYSASGDVNSKQVTGQGNFTLEVMNLKTSGFVQIHLVDKYVQIKTLKIDYTIDNVTFTQSGLDVAGMTEKELEQLFSTSLLSFFTEQEEWVSQRVSDYVSGSANKLMYGKTLMELIEWLKQFIHQ